MSCEGNQKSRGNLKEEHKNNLQTSVYKFKLVCYNIIVKTFVWRWWPWKTDMIEFI